MNMFFQRETSQKNDFDERQELVRNKGFKYAFYVLLCYNLLKTIWDIVQERENGQSFTGFAAVCVSVFFYAAYTIWNDGYFSFNEKSGSSIFTLVCIAAINLALGSAGLFTGLSDLPASPAAYSLTIGFTCLGILTVTLAKKLCTKTTDEEEKE